MFKISPEDFTSHEWELRNHVGDPKNKFVDPEDDQKIEKDSLIHIGMKSEPIMLICITMYNKK